MPALLAVLQDAHESEMVRHEAAEALGGIATPEVLPHLKEWMARPDAPRVVRESCQVALDMWEVRFGFLGCCWHRKKPEEANFCVFDVGYSTRTRASSSTRTDWTAGWMLPLLPPLQSAHERPPHDKHT